MIAKVVRFAGTGALLAGGFTLTGCLKSEEFPDEPILTFKSVEQTHELFPNGVAPERVVYVTVEFTDGDGDIGLDEGDTLSPFGTGEPHNFNTGCVFEMLRNGAWTDVDSEFPGRIKRISPSGQDPTLNGEIRWKVGPYPGTRTILQPDILAGDTMRVKMRLEDRALHMSNEAVSGAFVLE